jgi:hypothetical protein
MYLDQKHFIMKQTYVIQFPKQGVQGYVAAYSDKANAELFASVNELSEFVIHTIPDVATETVPVGRGNLTEIRFASHYAAPDGLYPPNQGSSKHCLLRLDPWLEETRMGLRLYVRAVTPGPRSRVLECREAYSKNGKHPLLLMPISSGTNLGKASDGLNHLVFARTAEEAATSKLVVRI